MKCLHITVAIMVVAGLLCSECSADDCAWAKHDYDDIYCLTKEYVEIDNQLNQSYNELQGLLDDADKKRLKKIQLKWMRQRDKDCGICIKHRFYIDVERAKDQTEAQLLFLNNILSECRSADCSLSVSQQTERQQAYVTQLLPTDVSTSKKQQVATDSTFKPIPPPDVNLPDVKLYANEHVIIHKIDYIKRKTLLTASQCALFSTLTRTVKKEIAVLPWVHISDVIHKAPLAWVPSPNVFTSDMWRSACFDFLLCRAADMSPLCVIQIERTNPRKWAKKERVLMTSACEATGLPLFEIQEQVTYEPNELKQILSSEVGNVVFR